MPSILVVKGGYARLDNISDDHKFIQDETFFVGDQKIEHKASASTRGLLRSYVELRKTRPEIFEGLVIMQQRAAYMDEITTIWSIIDLAKRVPQAVHQRDLFSAALGDTAKKAMQLSHHIPTWIASKMTPVLQLTDTDFAFPCKRAAAAAKTELAREMRSAAVKENVKATFKCGVEEIVYIAHKAHVSMVQMNAKDSLVLAGLRRNGMLVWRPDIKNGRLYNCEAESWCKDLPVGSHRLKDSWLNGRMDWLTPEGRPQKADWSRSEHAETEYDLAEADYCSKEHQKMEDHSVLLGGKLIEIPVVSIDCDNQELFSDKDALEMMHPKLRRMIKVQLKVTDHNSTARAAQKKVEKWRVSQALNCLEDEWKAHLAASLVTTSRSVMLSQLQPGVGGKSKKKIVKQKLKMVSVLIIGTAARKKK